MDIKELNPHTGDVKMTERAETLLRSITIQELRSKAEKYTFGRAQVLVAAEIRRRHEALITTVSNCKLSELITHKLETGNIESALMGAREFTRRDVPPILRKIKTERLDGEWETRQALLAHDLQWLGCKYPTHLRDTAIGKRVSSRSRHYEWIFHASYSTEHFRKGINYLFDRSRRRPWEICSDLKLTDAQQLECLYIHKSPVSEKKRRLFLREKPMLAALTAAAKKPGSKVVEPHMAFTVKRRLAIWFCYELADSSPSRAAHFYTLMTGDSTMTRQIISRQLQKIPKRLPLKKQD